MTIFTQRWTRFEKGFASASLLLVCLLLLFPVPARAVWEWMSPEQYLQDSTLIAILRVGEIHQAWTPENILIESATATVEKVIYYQFAAEDKLPDTIVVYTIDPNVTIESGYAHHSVVTRPSLEKGRVFVMLKMQGFNKFVPYDRFSFESLEKNKIYWPSESGKPDQLIPVDRVIDDIERLKHAMKPKQ